LIRNLLQNVRGPVGACERVADEVPPTRRNERQRTFRNRHQKDVNE
jgi:hypothetical protein